MAKTRETPCLYYVCVDPCPYGCTGGEEDEDKPIDHYITQGEIDWNREWERNHSK